MIVKFMAQAQTNNSSPNGGNKAKHWCLTLVVGGDNTVDAYRRKIEDISEHLVYSINGEEIGDGGLHHLQCYMVGKKQITRPTLRKWFGDNGNSFIVAKGSPLSNYEYCSKDGKFQEFGTLPETKNAAGGRATETKWKEIKDLAQSKKLAEIGELFPKELITHYRNLKQIGFDFNKTPEDLDKPCGEWIWGKSGVGKSFTARKENPGLFIKMMNKWWDNYNGEAVVLLEDFDPNYAISMSYFLKIWSDAYAFPVEIKNHSVMIRPIKVIVTSQYSLEQLFKDQETLEAMKRRFTQRNLISISVPKGSSLFMKKSTSLKRKEKPHDKKAIAAKRPRPFIQDKDGNVVVNAKPLIQKELVDCVEEIIISDSEEIVSSSSESQEMEEIESIDDSSCLDSSDSDSCTSLSNECTQQ